MVLFDEEVRALEKKASTYGPGGTVFYGSSSIRLWTSLKDDFPEIQSINLGFGGATLAACAWHFERLVLPTHPRALILYAGDNDLGEGRQPEEVCLFFEAIASKIQHHLPDVPVTFLSIKPSPARWHIVNEIRAANALIAEAVRDYPQIEFIDASAVMLTSDGQPDRALYQPDGLHLNSGGYARWREELHRMAKALQLPVPVAA